jgi:uncharacterized protein (DUF952 family)
LSDDPITFHLVAGEYYRDSRSDEPYTPEAYASDGFIHCTDGAENVAAVANRYYTADRRMYIALLIEKALVVPEIRYEDADAIYPHIYGPLNRDAIVGVVPVLRNADGTFVPPAVS